jgi:hypothetical protein
MLKEEDESPFKPNPKSKSNNTNMSDGIIHGKSTINNITGRLWVKIIQGRSLNPQSGNAHHTFTSRYSAGNNHNHNDHYENHNSNQFKGANGVMTADSGLYCVVEYEQTEFVSRNSVSHSHLKKLLHDKEADMSHISSSFVSRNSLSRSLFKTSSNEGK